MNPGKLDSRIVLQVKATTRSGDGGFVEAWTDAVSLWAEALPVTGREMIAARAVHAEVVAVFRIRYYDGLNESDYRIRNNGRSYDIASIQEEGREATHLISCTFTEGQP